MYTCSNIHMTILTATVESQVSLCNLREIIFVHSIFYQLLYTFTVFFLHLSTFLHFSIFPYFYFFIEKQTGMEMEFPLQGDCDINRVKYIQCFASYLFFHIFYYYLLAYLCVTQFSFSTLFSYKWFSSEYNVEFQDILLLMLRMHRCNISELLFNIQLYLGFIWTQLNMQVF